MKKFLIVFCMIPFMVFGFGHHHGGRNRYAPPPRHHHVFPIPRPFILPPPIAPIVPWTLQRIWVPPVYGIRPIYNQYGQIIGYERYVVREGYWKYI